MWLEASHSDPTPTYGGIISHLRPEPSRPRLWPTHLTAALNTPLSLIFCPISLSGWPAPYASCIVPGVAPPSGPHLISGVYSALVQGRPSVGAVERDGSHFLRLDPTPPDGGAEVPAHSPCRASAPRTKLPLSTYALSDAFLVSFLWPWPGRLYPFLGT